MKFPDSLRSPLIESRWADVLAVIGDSPRNPEERAVRAFALRGLEHETDAYTTLVDAVARDGRESPSAGLLREWLVADARFTDLDATLPIREAKIAEVEDTLLDAVRRHRQRDFRAAAALCERVLASIPEHPAALAHRSRALHNLGSRAQALEGFERAVAVEPLYCEGWQYLGIAARASARMDVAIRAFEHAFTLRPGFRAARADLAKTLLATERMEEARTVLVDCRSRFPDNADIAADLGYALHRLGRLDEARAVLSEAVSLDAHHAYAWLYLGMVASEMGDRIAVESALQVATRLLPQNPEVWAEMATYYETTNQLEEMRGAVEKGLAIAPRNPRVIFEAARLERRTGVPDAALRTLSGLVPSQLPPRQQRGYWYEMGRNLDRVDRPDEAWNAYVEANRLARKEMQRQLAGTPPLMPMLDSLAAQQPLTAFANVADTTNRSPVFLLGFPRSGITLVNTMLACHPSITTLEEQPTIESCVAQIGAYNDGYPGALAYLTARDVAQLRETYWRSVAQHVDAAAGNRVLVDMFPLRTIHIGLIRVLFPTARIVYAQRHPADVVLSNFMQDFATNAANLEFTDPLATANAYALALRIWQRNIATDDRNIFYVRYEDLIRSPEKTLRPLLDFIGIGWDPRVLTGYRERARNVRVATSSYHQVAEVLSDRSIGRWMKYRNQLAPVLPLLRPAADAFGYTL